MPSPIAISASRLVLILGIAVTTSMLACDGSIGPVPSAAGSQPAAPGASTPTASTPASARPSPIAPARSSLRAAVWLQAGDLREARNATNIAVVGAGEVLVVGSDYRTSWLSACGAATEGSDAVEIGDPKTKVWRKTTSLRSRREAPVLVGLRDGRAMLTGGETGESDGNVSYSSTYVFDPADRSWTRSGLMNTARSNPAGVLLADGRVLVGGGRYIDQAHALRMLDSSELWDPASGTWSRTGSLGDPRVGASAVTLEDGRVLIVGGVASPESVPVEQASTEVYDPVSGRWSSAGSLATARSGFALVALADGGALVVGGFGGPGTTTFERLSTVERFDPVSNTWSAAATLRVPVAGASGVRLADGRVLLAGGSAREPKLIDENAGTYVSGLTADALLFDPETGEWTATTPMPSRRAGASAIVLADGSIVLAGGSGSEGSPADTPGCPVAHPQVWRFVPGA
jgi:N-acetylneuraminic acid mutarotase